MDIPAILPYGRIQKTKAAQRKKKIHNAFDVSDTTELHAATMEETRFEPIQALYAHEYMQDHASPTEKPVTYGKMMLEELQNLRLGIITNRISKNNLKHLEHLVKHQMDQTHIDSQLRDILSDIETRIAVELEKIKQHIA